MSHLIITAKRERYEPPEWPLWYLLDKDSQDALVKAQRSNHRRKLIPPDLPFKKPVTRDLKLESLEEIEKVMRDNRDVSK